MQEKTSRINEILGLTNVPPNELREKRERPGWTETFLQEAINWSQRSTDAQTQVGCVLTTQDNILLSHGYNGFIRKIDDEVLPNLRPYKHPFMIHSEHNAVLNCAREGRSTKGAICYLTAEPCTACRQMLWQAGISKVIYTDWSPVLMTKSDEQVRERQVLDELIGDRMPIIEVPLVSIKEY